MERGHLLWWLTEMLRQRGEQVLYPQFPVPDQPSLSEWTDLLHAELAQLGDQERVVVCHSLGTALWLHAVRTLPADLRVTRVLLVSPLGEQAFTRSNGNEEFRVGPVDPAHLSAASAQLPRVVASATDCYTPTDVQAWAADLGLPCNVLPAAGHIMPADGYGPWPSVLEWCAHSTVPVQANPSGTPTGTTTSRVQRGWIGPADEGHKPRYVVLRITDKSSGSKSHGLRRGGGEAAP